MQPPSVEVIYSLVLMGTSLFHCLTYTFTLLGAGSTFLDINCKDLNLFKALDPNITMGWTVPEYLYLRPTEFIAETTKLVPTETGYRDYKPTYFYKTYNNSAPYHWADLSSILASSLNHNAPLGMPFLTGSDLHLPSLISDEKGPDTITGLSLSDQASICVLIPFATLCLGAVMLLLIIIPFTKKSVITRKVIPVLSCISVTSAYILFFVFGKADAIKLSYKFHDLFLENPEYGLKLTNPWTWDYKVMLSMLFVGIANGISTTCLGFITVMHLTPEEEEYQVRK